jgi:hypothetical protein
VDVTGMGGLGRDDMRLATRIGWVEEWKQSRQPIEQNLCLKKCILNLLLRSWVS